MKITAIVPYNGLKEVVQKVVFNIENIDINVEIGDLDEGVKLAKVAEMNGADVIISRGGTARLIQDNVRIPVVEIEVSAYDLLRVFTLIKDDAEKKAIVGFDNVIESAKTISNLIDMEISAYPIKYEKDVVPKLEELQKNGYQIIIGDTITVNSAEALGLNGLLLTSGKESVLKAIEDSTKFAGKKTEERITKHLLDQHKKATVIFNKNKEIVYQNKKFNQLKKSISKNKLNSLIEEVIDKKELKTILTYKECLLLIEGYVFSYDDDNLISMEIKVGMNIEKMIEGISIYNTNEYNPLQRLNWFTANNNIMKDVIAKAKTFTIKDENTLVYGESGTGKERLANLMYQGSSRSTYGLIKIDCEMISLDDWEKIFSTTGIVFYNLQGTIHLKKIDKLSVDKQKILLYFLESHCGTPRFISTATVDLELLIKEGGFLYDLYQKLDFLKIHIPPLRERKEDFETLVKLFINKFNYEYGKEIAGIRRDALKLLQEKTWTRNIDELIQLMKEIILISKGPFISEVDIKNIWDSHSFSTSNDIPIDKTLKEIELSIIKRVLKEEGGNHSQTAKRLGINRSTLWRKLKE